MGETDILEKDAQLTARSGPAVADPDHRLATFERLVDDAEMHMRNDAFDSAAVYAEVAAQFAMSHHPGLFASSRLERLLQELGQTITAKRDISRRSSLANNSRQRVLHVLTRAADVGGDARLVWRWIQQDNTRTHSVVLTRQGAQPVPAPIIAAVAKAGGQVTVLNGRRGSIRAWATALREIAASADIVVLHVHPYDVVPVIALADMESTPPVIVVDHADHAFWVGAGIANVVASLRESGMRLVQDRRGIRSDQSVLLPTILRPLVRTLSRREAKVQIGLDPDITVLLSIARPHKYEPLGNESFLAPLISVLEQHPRTTLLVIGPDDDGPWASAGQRTQGRVQALGTRHDTATYYQAADIYVDSFPIVSITSLLEAGSYGVPLISRCLAGQDPGILGADAPGLAQHLIRTADLTQYQAELVRLLKDVSYRETLGEQTRLAIERIHTGPTWQRSLEKTYQRAAVTSRLSGLPGSVDRAQAGFVNRMLPQVFATQPPLEDILQFHLRLLPPLPRARLWLRLHARSRRFYPGLLLPEWFGTRIEGRHRQWKSLPYVTDDVAERPSAEGRSPMDVAS